MPNLKPGVVYGESYHVLLSNCKENHYALPAVNVVGTNSVNAVLEAAALNRADVIIQLSNGGAQFYAGKGIKDDFQAKVLGAVSAARHIHLLAEQYGVCVVIHTDHANMKLVPWIEALLEHPPPWDAAPQVELDAVRLQQLRGLGYLGVGDEPEALAPPRSQQDQQR